MKKIFLLCYFLLCSFATINGTGYVVKLHNMTLYSDRPFTDDSVYFTFDVPKTGMDLRFLEKYDLVNDYTVLLTDKSSTDKYHVLFSKGNTDIFYGNDISDWDFDSGDIGAIKGRKSGYDNGDLLGIYEDDGVYSKEHALFLLDQRLSKVDGNNIFIVASGSEGHSEKIFPLFEKALLDNGYNIHRINAVSMVFGGFRENQVFIYLIAGLFWLIMVVMTVIALSIWLKAQETYCRVLLLFGAERPLIKVMLEFLFWGMTAFLFQAAVFLLVGEYGSYLKKTAIVYSFAAYSMMMGLAFLFRYFIDHKSLYIFRLDSK